MRKTPKSRPGRPGRLQVHAVLACAIVALASCISRQDIGTAQQAEIAGEAFTRALYAGYLDQAASEESQADWSDAEFYYDKAQAAARGEAIEPEILEDRSLGDDILPSLTAARDALVGVLQRGGPELAPEDSAIALVAFDCWVEQQEEAFQSEDIDICREEFEAALARAQAQTSGVIAVLLPSEDGQDTAIDFTTAAGATVVDDPLSATQAQSAAAPPEPPVPLSEQSVDNLFGEAIAAQPEDPVDYTLYFEAGTSDLTAASAAEIDGIIAFALSRRVTSLRVVGHTDTVGSGAVNARLSLRRAEQVRDLLVAAGAPADQVDVFSLGESNPVIPTPDNTPEPLNRRVVVTVR